MNKSYQRQDFSQNPGEFQRISDENGFVEADLRGAKFDQLDIKGTDFSGALLHGASFRKSKLNQVTFDRCKTGLTTTRIISLISLSLALCILAGLNAAYSIGFLVAISDIAGSTTGLTTLGVLCLGIVFFITIIIFFDVGITLSFLYILLVIVASSTSAAFAGIDFATYSILCNFCIIVSLASLLTEAKASFIVLEIARITDSTKFRHKLLYTFFLLGLCTLGALWGSNLVEKSEFSRLAFLGGDILCLTGFFLGKTTSRKYSSERFSLLRQFFAKIIKYSATSFHDAEFEDLSFKNSFIANCNFSPKKICGTLNLSGSNLDSIDKDSLFSNSNVFIQDNLSNLKKANNHQPNVIIIDGGSTLNLSQKQVNNAENSRYTEFTVGRDVNESGVAIGDNNDLKNSSSN